MSFQQFVCLSGLPRTGSTLLSAILSQNPLIHAEGNSAVSPLMLLEPTVRGLRPQQLTMVSIEDAHCSLVPVKPPLG